MNSSLPLIGFDRYVELDWCREAFEVAVDKQTEAQLREIVAVALPGKESQRKTLDILKRLSTKPFPDLLQFIARGLQLYESGGQSYALPLAWGCSIASYPFFGSTAQTTGRLLSLQGDCSIKEIQRRMAEAYGDRSGIERAVARVLQSQSNWGVLGRSETEKRVSSKSQIIIADEDLTAWLIEAAVRFAGKPLLLTLLHSHPVLFPFKLSKSLAYVVSKSPNLDLRSEGHANQLVELANF
jgi:hypothetical protein